MNFLGKKLPRSYTFRKIGHLENVKSSENSEMCLRLGIEQIKNSFDNSEKIPFASEQAKKFFSKSETFCWMNCIFLDANYSEIRDTVADTLDTDLLTTDGSPV